MRGEAFSFTQNKRVFCEMDKNVTYYVHFLQLRTQQWIL
jgi:hypothetical protein